MVIKIKNYTIILEKLCEAIGTNSETKYFN